MAKTWWEITVELVSGRGTYLWPRPGRVLLVRPGWTFRVLADGINDAFARRDRNHLHAFAMDDGTRITIPDPWGDTDGEDDTATTMTRLKPGEQFAFTFDYGDEWDHLCTVGYAKVDPLDSAGTTPDRPVPIFGWGDLPDQYGRRWNGDDGAPDPPPQPDPPAGDLPPLLADWGPAKEAGGGRQSWDLPSLKAFRAAMHQGDLGDLQQLLVDRDVGEVAQQATPAWFQLARHGGAGPLKVCEDVLAALLSRDWPGDRELADDLRAALGFGPQPATAPLPVDLDHFVTQLNTSDFGHWYVRLSDGQLVGGDEMLTGIPLPDDIDDETLYLPIVSDEHRNEAWHDMVLFIDTCEDDRLVERLTDAVHGQGGFRRFRAVMLDHPDEWHRWRVLSDERRLGRARRWLAVRGFRPALPVDTG